ncbi:FmdB family zinc ribbon protein [Desulfonatronum thioautotrophicum]|uniref:FmdB family zinc ribbon protein n=1 Tax=Desulfonatronum thioautotrophicum TaxID=617001 RepID=UPI000A02AA55
MPIFEYSCPHCNHAFEELTRSSTEEAKPCPKCGSQQAVKVPSVCGRLATGRASDTAYGGPPPSGCGPGRGVT